MALMNVLRFSRLACDTGRKLGSQSIPRISVKPLLKRFITIKPPVLKEDKISVTFVKANGEKIETKGNIGDSLLDVVVNNDIDLDGYGACEGTLTCSTCHLILEAADFNKLPEKASDEELDMLDLAFDLTDTSRLGCQIILSKDLDGLVVKVPASINDARSSELK